MLEFDQNILSKYHLKETSHDFITTKRQRKTCFVEGWDVIPKQNAEWQKSMTKWLTIQHHSWISYSGHICVLPSNFDHLSFWGCSMTIWLMTTSFTDSTRLLITNFRTWFLQLFNWIAWNPPPMIFKSPVWIISPRKIVIAWDLMKSGH